MDNIRQRAEQFVKYVSALSGNEKGEAQVFIDRLFQTFAQQLLQRSWSNC